METVQRVLEVMRPHWNSLALAVTWLGIVFVAVRRRWQWRQKRFITQVNFSLNYRVGDQLAMRTLLETTAGEVWPNEHGVRQVLALAARATVENPFVLLKKSKDRDFVNRAVLNALSQRFAEVFVAAALGVPVRTATFVFAVTCEKFAEIRTLKLRVLLVEEAALDELFGPGAAADRLDVRNQVYRARLTTLRKLYDLHVKDKGQEQPVLGRVELGVVAGAGQPGAVTEALCGTSGCATA
jgi:hypothetical protein